MRWCSWLRHCVIRREVAGSSFDGVIEIFHSLILPTTLRSNRNEYFLGSKGGLRDSNGLRVGRKMANFQLYFQSREQVVVRRGTDPENRVGDQDSGSPGKPVSSGLQVSGEPGRCRAKTRPPW